jgi:hypothetical protein
MRSIPRATSSKSAPQVPRNFLVKKAKFVILKGGEAGAKDRTQKALLMQSTGSPIRNCNECCTGNAVLRADPTTNTAS